MFCLFSPGLLNASRAFLFSELRFSEFHFQRKINAHNLQNSAFRLPN